MIDNYLNYRDVVFVNRRLTKTRFSKSLILFCGVNNQGKNVLFGFALMSKETEENYQIMMDNFKKAYGTDNNPQLFIVEKSSPLKSVL
mgnify:CR=1 FL=1